MFNRTISLLDQLEAWLHRNELERCAECGAQIRRRDMVAGCCSRRCADQWTAAEQGD